MGRGRSFTAEERDTWTPLAALLELMPRQLDAQLLRDEGITHFDYFTLSVLALDPAHRMRMSELASQTNATLPRLSHAVTRLEKRGLVRRVRATDDARATDVEITAEGRRTVIGATPGHVDTVRHMILDALTPEQRAQLRDITAAVLARLDPDGRMAITRRR